MLEDECSLQEMQDSLRSWIVKRPADKQTERAAELPSPAPIGISDSIDMFKGIASGPHRCEYR